MISPTVPGAAKALAEVRQILREVLRDCKVTIYLFGSWARGEISATSDIDLAIEPHAPLPPGALARLRERFEESHVPYRVELVELTEVDPGFRQRVLAEGIRWND